MAPRRGIGTRVNQRVSKLTENVERFQTPLGLLVLAVAALLAYIAFISTTGPPFQSKYQVKVQVPADAPVLRRGEAVRVGGRLAGLISDVEPDREHRATLITANITKTDFRPMPVDTTAYVRVHSIVYATYLELRPGTSDEELGNGETLKAPASSGTDLLEVVQLFDEQTRKFLSDTLVNVGFGVAGRGSEANQALRDLPELARNATSELRAVTRKRGALADIVAGAARTSRGLRGERTDDVAALIGSADTTLGTVAGRNEELRQTIQRLPAFEDELLATAPIAKPLLDDVAGLADELRPAAQGLNDQLPELVRLLGLGGVLRTNVAKVTAVADPLLSAARPVVFGLFPTMTALGPLNANLAILKATVKPYKAEIAKAGKRLGDATSHPVAGGLAPGAVAGRVVPVLTPHPCTNPIPAPGQAEEDSC